MKTRIIHTRFWQDEFVNTLNPKEKLLFVYLLTNDRVSLTGMYELPDKYIRADLELTQKEIDVAKQKMSENGKILFFNGWIKIVNHDRYNNYHGEKIEKAKGKENALIPQELIEYQYLPDTSIDTSSDTINNHKSKDIIKTNNPKEKMIMFIKSVQTKDESYTGIIDYLKEKGIDENLAKTEIAKFVDYWTELNKTGSKEKWEMQKTFEVQKRLVNWFNNIKGFNKYNERVGKNYDE